MEQANKYVRRIQMSEELKPCPFCGGEPKTTVESKANTIITVSICCKKCHAEIHDSVIDLCDLDTMQRAINNVIGAWNRRIENE